MMDDFEHYKLLKDKGRSALDVYLIAKEDGIDSLGRIRVLRSVFGLTLDDAKKVSFVGDTGEDFEKHSAGNAEEYKGILDDELGLGDD